MARVREEGFARELATMIVESSSFRCYSFVAATGAVVPKLASFAVYYLRPTPWKLEMEAGLYHKEVEVVPHQPLENLDSVPRSSWMESKVVVQNSLGTSLALVVPNCTDTTKRDSEELANSPWLVDMQELRWNSRSLRWS